MDIKQLKASFQLAQMRCQVNPTEDNKILLNQAEQAYLEAKNPDAPAKSESQKIDQVLQDSVKKVVTMEKPVKKAIQEPAKPSQATPKVAADEKKGENLEDKDQNSQVAETVNQEKSESEEKKTE